MDSNPHDLTVLDYVYLALTEAEGIIRDQTNPHAMIDQKSADRVLQKIADARARIAAAKLLIEAKLKALPPP